MCEQFCSHCSNSVFARSSSAHQPPKPEFMTAHTTMQSSNISTVPLVTMVLQDVALAMFFLALFFPVFWKKSSNYKQGAGGLLLVNQLLLPSKKKCGEGYTCSTEPPEESLCVCIYIYRLWIFYPCPLEPENVNNKRLNSALSGHGYSTNLSISFSPLSPLPPPQ